MTDTETTTEKTNTQDDPEAFEAAKQRVRELPSYGLSHVVSGMGYAEATGGGEDTLLDLLVNPGLQFYGGFATGVALAIKDPALAKRYLTELRDGTGYENGGGKDDQLSDHLIDCAAILDKARAEVEAEKAAAAE